jgi:hypothetical protein
MHEVLARVKALVPLIRRNAARFDADASFPAPDIEALREAGALRLAVGKGELHTDQLASMLSMIGAGNLSVGRIFEAHVNAVRLIERYGTSTQRHAVQKATRAGELFALWVTDPPSPALRIILGADGWRLQGSKMFCSAAGHVDHAVVTATLETGEHQMAIVPCRRGEQVRPLPGQLQGMRAAVTGMVDFTGVTLDRDAVLGRPGDYLREPDFSCGAWRGSAIAQGGLTALLEGAVEELRARGRLENPHQLARIGEAEIARETCALWVRSAARIAEDDRADPKEAVAYVGLARIAVETACLDAIRLVQRSLGLSAFRQGHDIERICRDLATYLRQPAPDDVLTEAASWYARTLLRDQT